MNRLAFYCLGISLVVMQHCSFTDAIDINITGLGNVRGKSTYLAGRYVDVFQGIPFAEPPTGNRRFRPPVKVSPWSGLRNATNAHIYCPQVNSINSKIIGNEDCLYLSIYRPRKTGSGLLPVMVWIHGGSFLSSSGSDYNGEMLAAKHDVVVVIPNYRLGVLGFFNVPNTNTTGNYGLLDQISALTWTKSHIESFSGDPNRVTVFGLSAGAASVTLLMLSPLSKGLFSRVIAQSGAANCFWAISTAQSAALSVQYAVKLGCDNSTATATSCLRGKTMKEIMQQQILLPTLHPITFPSVDGVVFEASPRDQLAAGKLPISSVELLSGFNKDEGTMFVPNIAGWNEAIFQNLAKRTLSYSYNVHTNAVAEAVTFQYPRYEQTTAHKKYALGTTDFKTDHLFVQCIANFAAEWAKLANVSYLYEFTYLPKHPRVPRWLVSHGIEVDFVFGKPFYPLSHPAWKGRYLKNYTATDKNVSANVMQMWTNFAKTGNPGYNWPKYDLLNKRYLNIDLTPTVQTNIRPKALAFWNTFVPRFINMTSTCSKTEVAPSKSPTKSPAKEPTNTAMHLYASNSFIVILSSVVYFLM